MVFIALLSIWRIRSAETPYSSARSCSVADESSSRNQRASMIRRLRSSSLASAVCRPFVRFCAVCWRSRICAGSSSLSVRYAIGDTKCSSSPGVGSSATIVAAETRFHLDHFLGLDAQVAGDRLRFGHRKGGRARLHAAQVEEQLALRLGRGDLDQPPVAQDVLVHLGANPVQRERHEPHAALGVEAADGLHEAHIAFLDEIGLRQPVSQVVARHGDHQPQVRQHQLAGGVDIIGFLQTPAERGLQFRRQQGEPVYRLDVMVEASQ